MKRVVCHITTLHPANDVRIFKKQCIGLSEDQGLEVHLLAVNGIDPKEGEVVMHCPEVNSGNRITQFYKTGKVAYRKALEINADIYHFHDPNFLPWASKLKKKGKRVVYDVHEDLPRQILGKSWIPKMFRSWIANSLERFEDKVSQRVNGIVAATPVIADRFRKLNPNTITVCNFPIVNHETSFLERKENVICYVGGVGKNRGLIELIQAVEDLDVVLHIAGRFESEPFEKQLKSMPGWTKVKYHGFIDKKEVEEIYRQSSIGVVVLHPLINYLEALPVKMFEYMNFGLAVISSDFPYWKNIMDDAGAGITIPAQQADRLKEAIRGLIDSPSALKTYGDSGKQAIISKYNWESEFKGLKKFYAEI